jgi:hypothetical protein
MEMKESGVINGKNIEESKVALVYGQMNEPPGDRMRVGLTALTMVEYFRDVNKQDVLLYFDPSSLCTCRRFDRPCSCHNICTFGRYYRTFQRISFQGYLSHSRSFRFNLNYVTALDCWLISLRP